MAFENKLIGGEGRRAMACRARSTAHRLQHRLDVSQTETDPCSPNLGDMCSISPGCSLCLQHVIFLFPEKAERKILPHNPAWNASISPLWGWSLPTWFCVKARLSDIQGRRWMPIPGLLIPQHSPFQDFFTEAHYESV